jgi:MoaA/NifB/PqqE/SkfB family radical SAM enzyme
MFEASSPPATRIQIDASAHCQLACPSCPTASGATKAAMGAGQLDPAKFDALLADNPELLEVELSNYGEMFLNPRLAEILKAAHERDVVVHADNGVNLNHVSDGVLEAVVRYRVRSMTVSIDGATPESYAKYRVRGDFKRVIGNIRRLNQYKQQFKTVFPMLSWQFIVFGHNELEIAAARRLAGKLGMSFSPKVSWDDDVSPVRNKELVRIQTGLSATREEHHRKTGAAYLRPICHQLWHSPVVNWDGRIMGCCRNFWGEFGGNAFQDGLAASLESPALRQAKQMLMGRDEPAPGIPCTTCDLFLTMRKDGNWITEKELASTAMQPATVAGVIEAGDTRATHADVCVAPPGVDPRLPGKSTPPVRYLIGTGQVLAFQLLPGREYTLHIAPQRASRVLPAVAISLAVKKRPIVKEFRIVLGDRASYKVA